MINRKAPEISEAFSVSFVRFGVGGPPHGVAQGAHPVDVVALTPSAVAVTVPDLCATTFFILGAIASPCVRLHGVAPHCMSSKT